MPKNYWVENKQESNNITYDLHLHPNYEINLILTDGVDIFINDTSYISKRGDVFFMPSFTFHQTNTKGIKYQRYLIYFDNFAIAEMAPFLVPALNFLKNCPVNVIHLNEEDVDKILNLLDIASNAQQQKQGIFTDFENICSLGNILSFIISKIDLEAYLNSDNKKEDLTKKILSYVTENIETELLVSDICKRFDISKSTLWNMMKKNLDMSLKEYIVRVRISRAMDLLTSGLSVTEVSNKCGFNSYAHFIRTFTKIVGFPPHKYSKMQQKLQSDDHQSIL